MFLQNYLIYNSHPVADVFQNQLTEALHKIKNYYDDDDGDCSIACGKINELL